MEAYVLSKGWTTFDEMQADRKALQRRYDELQKSRGDMTERMDYLEKCCYLTYIFEEDGQ